jgi:hypothetical protein
VRRGYVVLRRRTDDATKRFLQAADPEACEVEAEGHLRQEAEGWVRERKWAYDQIEAARVRQNVNVLPGGHLKQRRRELAALILRG